MENQAGARGRTHRKFSEIRRPETPERRARIDSIKAAMAEGERLYELRKEQGVTQIEVADRLGVSQGSVSELERREDVYLSTLRGYVEALGGQLEINAVFGTNRRRVALGSSMMLAGRRTPHFDPLIQTRKAAKKATKPQS